MPIFSQELKGSLLGDAEPESHLSELPGTEWMVWKDALLRTTGFPAARLECFHATRCAEVTDSFLSGVAAREEFDRHYAQAQAASSAQVHAIASDPLFREAVTWQNPSVLLALDKIVTDGGQPPRNRRQRERERVVARYWQRYCAKTETIGFFGPVCWVTADPAAPAVTVSPGPGMLRHRRLYLEHWALAEVAASLSASLAIRRWLAPALQPHLCLDGRQVLVPAKPPVPLSSAEASVLALADGRTPATRIAARAVAQPGTVLRKPDDVYVLLDQLLAKGIVAWALDVPIRMDGEDRLRDQLAAIGDSTERARALATLDRLSLARDQVSAATGCPDKLPAAIARLESEFAAITAESPARKPGEAYAGRRIYWEEATRDLTVTIGKPVLDVIAEPLAIVLQAARWLSAELARAYLEELGALHAELAAGTGSAEVQLGQLWFYAQGLFYGTGERPCDEVTAEFSRRWAELLDLGSRDLSAAEIKIPGAGLRQALATAFPAAAPGWADARLHSPDVQLGAASVDAMNAGRFVAVLSEMHIAWAANGCGGAVSGHDDPRQLRAALAADLGPNRVRPLLPVQWPRNVARLAFALDDPSVVQLGILPAPGADPDRLLPVSSVSVLATAGGDLVARAADGRSWPLSAIFASALSEVAVEAFKLVDASAHTPRIVIDDLVVTRETWRTTIGEAGLMEGADDRERYLATRRWARGLGLPERVFVKIATELKPVFADLTSPLYVAVLHHMLRAARAERGDAVSLSVTEMLPLPADAWVPDALGRGYISELRLQLRDLRRGGAAAAS